MHTKKWFHPLLACCATCWLVTGCGASGNLSGTLDSNDPKDGEVVFDAAATSSLQALLDDHVTFSGESGISLSISVGKDQEWHGVSGLADIKNNTPMEKGMRFRAGSNTKMFVASIVMQLLEEEKIKLEEPLSNYFPTYARWQDITVKQLLGMRSGIPEYLQSKWMWAAALWNPAHAFTPQQLLSYVKDKPLEFAPGEGCSYSNSNTILLGLIIEKITGEKLENVLNERIISRLGLENTYLDTGSRTDQKLAHGYIDGVLASATMGVPQAIFSMIRREHFVGDMLVDATRLFHPSATWAAGGIVSNTDDLSKFIIALFEGKIVNAESLEKMLTFEPCTVLNATYDYGLGMMRHPSPFGPAYGHGGLNFGYKTETFYVPDADIAWSEMGGWFPEQTATINQELLKLAAEGTVEPMTSCPVPEGIFAPTTGTDSYLDLRFRGRVNAPGHETPGTANFTAMLTGSRKPYYGAVSHVQLNPAENPGRLETVSIAPTGVKTQIKLASTSISYDALAGLGTDGTLTINADDKFSTRVFLADVTLNAASQKPEKMCFTAVPDFAREGKISICEPDKLKLEEGNLLRMFGRVPMTTVQTEIETFVAAMNLEPCMCFSDAGALEPCPPPPQ